jgi:hypothetical protein
MRGVLLLFLLVPIASGCLPHNDQKIAASDEHIAALGNWKGVLSLENGTEWLLPQNTEYVALGPNDEILHISRVLHENCTMTQTVRLLDRNHTLLLADDSIVASSIFYDWQGGFGAESHWNWLGEAIEVPWGGATHVSDGGSTWAFQNQTHIRFGGDLEGTIRVSDAILALDEGRAAIALPLEGEIHLLGVGSWYANDLNDISFHGDYLYIAGSYQRRISPAGEMETTVYGSGRGIDANDGAILAYKLDAGGPTISIQVDILLKDFQYRRYSGDWVQYNAIEWTHQHSPDTTPLEWDESGKETPFPNPLFGLLALLWLARKV